MDLTPGQKKLLPWWGPIVGAVSERVQTAELWQRVRDAAAAEGVELRGVSAIDMGGMRSIAASQQRSMDAVGRLGMDQAITAEVIGRDISSRDLGAQSLAPSWIVRFEHDVTREGELFTLWRSSVFEGSLPPTKRDLLDVIEGDAQALADDYNETHLGVGRISIVAV